MLKNGQPTKREAVLMDRKDRADRKAARKNALRKTLAKAAK